MAYLNLDPNYPNHPKIVRLKVLLGPESDIYPIRLWCYCARIHPSDSFLKNYSSDEIEAIIGWKGSRGIALKALKSVGLIERVKNGFVCHDWLEHEGHLEAFSRRGKVAAKARWEKACPSMPQALLKQCASYAPTNQPTHTLPNLTLPNQTQPVQTDQTATENGERRVDLSIEPPKRTTDLVGETIDKMVSKTKDPTFIDFTEIIMPWGEYKGCRISDIDHEYCHWLISYKLEQIRTTFKEPRLEAALRARVKAKLDERKK